MKWFIYAVGTLLVLNLHAQNSPEAGGELKRISWLLGSWMVTVDARTSKDGPFKKSTGKATIVKSVGNTIIEEDYTSLEDGKEYVARVLLGNDNRNGMYQMMIADSDHGVLVLYEGNLSGDSLLLDHTIHLGETRILRRMRYRFVSNEEFHRESLRSTDEGKTWSLSGKSIYRRAK